MSNDKHNAAYHGINGPDDPYDRNADPASGLADKPKKRKRIFMWFFLAVQALFIIWITVGGASNAQESTNLTGTEADAYAVGTGIGIFLILIVWFIVDVILAIGYLVVRASRRDAR